MPSPRRPYGRCTAPRTRPLPGDVAAHPPKHSTERRSCSAEPCAAEVVASEPSSVPPRAATPRPAVPEREIGSCVTSSSDNELLKPGSVPSERKTSAHNDAESENPFRLTE